MPFLPNFTWFESFPISSSTNLRAYTLCITSSALILKVYKSSNASNLTAPSIPQQYSIMMQHMVLYRIKYLCYNIDSGRDEGMKDAPT
nr:MAG TPA: hypothetical protein [Caudoviricetes sp.]